MTFKAFKHSGVDSGLKQRRIRNEIQLDYASNLRKDSSTFFGIQPTLIQFEILQQTQFQWLDILGVKKNISQIGT